MLPIYQRTQNTEHGLSTYCADLNIGRAIWRQRRSRYKVGVGMGLGRKIRRYELEDACDHDGRGEEANDNYPQEKNRTFTVRNFSRPNVDYSTTTRVRRGG